MGLKPKKRGIRGSCEWLKKRLQTNISISDLLENRGVCFKRTRLR